MTRVEPTRSTSTRRPTRRPGRNEHHKTRCRRARDRRRAVRLLFDGNDTVPIYVLAAAAREITTALCIKRGIESFLDIAQQEHAQLSRKELYRIVSRHAGFFKHADRDADAS
jgi:hypothetical protein